MSRMRNEEAVSRRRAAPSSPEMGPHDPPPKTSSGWTLRHPGVPPRTAGYPVLDRSLKGNATGAGALGVAPLRTCPDPEEILRWTIQHIHRLWTAT